MNENHSQNRYQENCKGAGATEITSKKILKAQFENIPVQVLESFPEEETLVEVL